MNRIWSDNGDLKYNQIIYKIKLGISDIFGITKTSKKIIFLSCGILFAKDDQLIFYNYKNIAQKLFNIKSLKGKNILKLSLLQNNNFCVYCQNNTYIFEFDKENYTIKEITQVDINLKSLIETKEHKYINFADNMIYI